MLLKNMEMTIAHEVDLEEERVEQWKKELLQLPEGSMYMTTSSDKTYFYHFNRGQRRGITRDRDLIHALARKKYLKILIKEHKKVLDCAARGITDRRIRGKERTVSLPLQKLLDQYMEAGLEVARITCSDMQYSWMKEPYVGNTLEPEMREYVTFSGINVRSKSEQTIGNALETRGIPYRYEQAFKFNVAWMEGVSRLEKVYYPDFTIVTANGKYILWEHLGRVDSPGYRIHNMEKIAAYRQGGLCEERQLILTFESDLKNPERLDEIIRNRVLRYI